jgi:hypothetical protein
MSNCGRNLLTIIFLVLLAATPSLALKSSVDPHKTHLVISPQLSFPVGSFSDVAGFGGGLSVDYRRPLDATIELTASVGGLLFATQKGPEQLFPVDAGLNFPGSLELESRIGTSIFPAKVGIRYVVDNNIFLKLELGDLYSRVEREGIITQGTEKGVTLGRTETNSHGLLISIGAGLAKGMHRAGIELSYSPRGSGPLRDGDLAWFAIFFGI